jgi:hypothetical protein
MPVFKPNRWDAGLANRHPQGPRAPFRRRLAMARPTPARHVARADCPGLAVRVVENARWSPAVWSELELWAGGGAQVV